MGGKFSDVPADRETEVRKSRLTRVDGYPALHQLWHWRGINGESLVFADDDVARLTNGQLKKRVQASEFVRSKTPVMLQRPGTGFTFVNFNYGA